MLSPRLTNCVDCTSIPSLLQDIDCKIASIAKDLYNNTIFSLNRSINGLVMSDLINYRRILRYRYCNSNYASPFTIEEIASRVKLLTIGCCPCSIQPTVIQGVTCTAGGYWYNTVAPDEASYYPESMEIDDDCNIYSLSKLSDDSSSTAYRKFDPTGVLVWEKTQSNDCGSAYPSEMKIDLDGNVYIVYNTGIRKIDGDGNILWEKYWDISSDIIGINFDNNGSLFASLSGDNNYIYLVKLSTSTGTVLVQKEIEIPGSSPYTNNAPLIDSDGNVLIAVAYSDVEYFTTIIKFSNDLSTVIWDARLDQADFGEDCDLTGFQIDENNNVYGCNYGTSIFKLNSDGTFAWARTLTGQGGSAYDTSIYALTVSPEGDVFWVGVKYDCDWRNDCITDANYIVINKFNTSGVYQWTTAIGSDDDPYFDIELGSWDYSQDAAKIRNGVLMIVGYRGIGNENEYLFKLPLTQITPAKYGEQYFYDITSYLTSQSITSTILSSSYIVNNSTILDTLLSCTFTDFTPTLNITNTIIP